MKFYKNSVVGVLGISLLLGLSACSSKQPPSSPKTQQPASNSSKQQPTQMSNSSQKQPSTSNQKSNSGNQGQESPQSQKSSENTISTAASNFSNINFSITNGDKNSNYYVGGKAIKPPKFTHGIALPMIMKISFANIKSPIKFNVNDLQILPSDGTSIYPAWGWGINYFKFNGQLYKTNTKISGRFLVKSTMTIKKDTTIVFEGEVSVPNPNAKFVVKYAKMTIGTYPVNIANSYHLK